MKLTNTVVRFAGCGAAIVLGATAACSRMPSVGTPSLASIVMTRAERTAYRETSTHADVLAFLDTLSQKCGPLTRSVLARSPEGREVPVVVLSRPRVASVTEARALGRPLVYVQANIHAGEVEGKEALQAMMRDLWCAPASRKNVLDSIVLLAVPIYNADGNEKFADQSRNRTEQNGPAMVGERANGQGLDLNRDYIKAEAPETRGALGLFNEWNPDVFVDLHTTDGSFHGYALTYSPSLSPAARDNGYTRDSLLPELRRRVRERRGFETFDYGNFDAVYEERDITDTVKRGWWTYDHRLRFGTNYYGIRGGFSVLSEAYSHDPFERRVKATYAFVSELLSLVAERSSSIRNIRARVAQAARAPTVAIRGRITDHPLMLPVTYEDLERTGDSARTQPGVPAGIRRTGRMRTRTMPVYDRFDATEVVSAPVAYAIPATQSELIRLLRTHGIRIEHLTQPVSSAAVTTFVVDSVQHASRPFQGHLETRITGSWRQTTRNLPIGSYIVPTTQPLGALATYLLEPTSDDGAATWNVLDRWLVSGGEYPAIRVTSLPANIATKSVP